MQSPRHSRYARHRFPPEVISDAAWLYFRFPLSLLMVEEMLAAHSGNSFGLAACSAEDRPSGLVCRFGYVIYF